MNWLLWAGLGLTTVFVVVQVVGLFRDWRRIRARRKYGHFDD